MVRRHWFLAFPSPLSTHRQSGTMDERHGKCRWIVGGATGIGFAAAACPVHPGNVGAKRFAFRRRARKRLQRICRDSGRSHPGARRNRYGRPNLSWSARRCRTFHRLSGECRIEGVPRLIDKSLPGRSDPAPGDPLGRRSDHRRGADRARSLAMGTVRASGVHSYMDRDLRLERRDRDVRHRVRVVDH